MQRAQAMVWEGNGDQCMTPNACKKGHYAVGNIKKSCVQCSKKAKKCHQADEHEEKPKTCGGEKS